MDCRLIAQTMCDLTREELWEPRRDWALQRRPDGELILRVGSGKATCVRHSPSGRGPLKLTYGVKMISSKSDPERLCQWRASREILERSYFGGELTMLNSLAHTIVHEFGHVVLVLMGARNPGSSHSPEFYRILDKAHRNGHAERIRDRLHAVCRANGIDLSSVVSCTSSQQTLRGSGLSMEAFAIGTTVYLHENAYREHNPLTVIKKNRKTIVVRSTTTDLGFKASPNVLYLEE